MAASPAFLSIKVSGPLTFNMTAFRTPSFEKTKHLLTSGLALSAVCFSCHPKQPIEPIVVAAAEPSMLTTFGDAYSQVGKITICTKPGLMPQAIASVQGFQPYKVLTETEGQGSVPPGGNNIQLGYVNKQRSLKTALKIEKLRVLLIGGSRIGTKIAEALVQSGRYTTSALVTDTTPSDPSNSWIVQKYKDMGVALIQGDLDNHESLVEALKNFDVVISVLGYAKLTYQIKIINAIKEAGNIKRFIISAEFINDAGPGDHVVDPAELLYENLVLLKQNVETAGIPYTFISYNFLAGPSLPYLGLGGIGTAGHPTDKVTISGNGNLKVDFVTEEDVATWTIKAIEDPGTRNKIFVCSGEYKELMPLYEKKV